MGPNMGVGPGVGPGVVPSGGGLPPSVGPVSFTIPGEFGNSAGSRIPSIPSRIPAIPQPPPFPFFGGLNEKKLVSNPFDAPQMLEP